MEYQSTIAVKAYGTTQYYDLPRREIIKRRSKVCIYKESKEDGRGKLREKRLFIHVIEVKIYDVYVDEAVYTVVVDLDTDRMTYEYTDIYDALGYYNSITL